MGSYDTEAKEMTDLLDDQGGHAASDLIQRMADYISDLESASARSVADLSATRENIEPFGVPDSPILDRLRSLRLGTVDGLADGRLQQIVAGERKASSLDFALIATQAGVTVDWLLHGEAP